VSLPTCDGGHIGVVVKLGRNATGKTSYCRLELAVVGSPSYKSRGSCVFHGSINVEPAHCLQWRATLVVSFILPPLPETVPVDETP